MIVYNCTAITGGGSRSVDAITASDLSDQDRAIVMNASDEILLFEFQSAATDTEQVATHPFRVRPDDYTSAGVWYEQETRKNVLYDRDGDTYIKMEASPDEDKVRIAAGGVEGFVLNATGEITMKHQTALKVSLAASQDIPSASLVRLQFVTNGPPDCFDRNGDWDNSNYRFTAPEAGLYMFNLNTYLKSMADGNVCAPYIYINNNLRYFTTHRPGAAGNGAFPDCYLATLDAGATVWVGLYQNNAATKVARTLSYSNFLTVHRVA